VRDAYLQMLFYNFIRSPKYDKIFGEGWVTADDITRINEAAYFKSFEDYDLQVVPASFLEIFLAAFNEVLANGGIVSEGDEFTGVWYKINPQEKANIVKRSLSQNPAAQRLNNLGEAAPTAYRNALGRIVAEGLAADADADDVTSAFEETSSEVPASDRIVRLSDNQASEIAEPIDEIIAMVESQNSVGGGDGIRELILGRLKAGRELIRAAIFSAESLQLTLIVGLRMLVEQYKDHAIGAAAGKLLDLLVEAIRNA